MADHPDVYDIDFIPNEFFRADDNCTFVGFRNQIKKAREAGYKLPVERTIFMTGMAPDEWWVNMSRVNGIDATDPAQYTQGEIICAEQNEEIVRYLKAYIPGFENAYVSEYHRRLFGGGDMEVHPDDLADVLKNAIATIKHLFQGNKNMTNLKIIREYRAKIGDRYRRVTETVQVLETDRRGNIWLALCVMEVSANQSPPFTVNSQVINMATGEVFSPLTQYYQQESILTKREVEILTLIAQGKLSKEIADSLCISVHTVNTYRQHILEKLNVDNSHEAVRYAQSIGLIEY